MSEGVGRVGATQTDVRSDPPRHAAPLPPRPGQDDARSGPGAGTGRTGASRSHIGARHEEVIQHPRPTAGRPEGSTGPVARAWLPASAHRGGETIDVTTNEPAPPR